jgi:hypothetical protein
MNSSGDLLRNCRQGFPLERLRPACCSALEFSSGKIWIIFFLISFLPIQGVLTMHIKTLLKPIYITPLSRRFCGAALLLQLPSTIFALPLFAVSSSPDSSLMCVKTLKMKREAMQEDSIRQVTLHHLPRSREISHGRPFMEIENFSRWRLSVSIFQLNALSHRE